MSRWAGSGVEPLRTVRMVPLVVGRTTVTTWCVESCSCQGRPRCSDIVHGKIELNPDLRVQRQPRVRRQIHRLRGGFEDE